jgi:AraC-like DNA-binding protein
VTIDSLAQMACLSRKQFERVFQDSVGTSPKRFLRTIRFQHAVDEKSRNQELNFTELTYKCGYYDQSHMTTDFRKLTGMTPKEYFSNCDPYSDYFQ